MLKVVVFDCDGVMFDSLELNRRYYNSLLEHFGYAQMDEEELEQVHIQNVMDSVAHIFRNHPQTSLEEVHAFRVSLNYIDFLPYLTIAPDLKEFLEAIKGKYRLAISTNRSDTMDTILEKFELVDYFEKVMTASRAKRPKPAPDALLEIMEFFQCEASEMIHIGDSVFDEWHAKGANVPLIAYKNRDLNTDFHVDSFMEILDLPPFK